MAGKRLCVMANSKSGRGSEKQRLSQIMDGLSARGADAVLRSLEKGENFGRATRNEVNKGAQMIIAAGGDGTMSGVAEALMGTDTAMGIVPLGTFNYFARSLGVPEDIEGALDVIACGYRLQTSVGCLNDRLFLNNASLGIYPQILRTRETTYAKWGRSRIAAYWSVVQTMMRLPKPLKLEITVDGQHEIVKTPLAFVVSNAFQLRQMGLEGADCIEQGQLALLIAHNTGRVGLLRNGAALLMGRAEKNRDFRLICAPSLLLQSQRKSLLVARDGEREKMSGPFEAEMRVSALNVIAPEQETQKVR